ncbi:MAG: proprotein convertase P-domain-containing protein [Planctomycetes bacterium]|nr:proprotein convertase P-domain-containing protein [Planctomycetota bacterium]
MRVPSITSRRDPRRAPRRHLGRFALAAALSAAGTAPAADGVGRVFAPNPVVTLRDPTLRDESPPAAFEPAYIEVPLRDISGQGTAADPYVLSGLYVTTEGTPGRARSLDGRFLFDRDDPRFEEVMVYFHIDSIQRRIQALGFPGICRRPIQVYVNSQPPGIPFPSSQSYYSPDGTGMGVLAFGTGGIDAAEDAEIIAHEYGHAILDAQVPNFGASRESFAIAEGFCDFLSAAVLAPASGGFGDACIGEWKAAPGLAGAPACLRRLDTAKRYPYDLTYVDRHRDGEIWSGTLWDIGRGIGIDETLALVLAANFLLAPDAGFSRAGEALLQADRDRTGGTHRDTIEAVLRERGILRPPLRLEGFALRDEEPDLPIPDEDPFGVESEIEWPGADAVLSALSIQVYVDIAHPFPPDLEVSLTSPAGTSVAIVPPWRFPTIYGSWDRPEGSGFAALAGEGATGTWRLRAVDTVAREKGTLRGWGIRILNIVRGETNDDGRIDLADAIRILQLLFGGAEIACWARADIDDDGVLDLADAMRLLAYLFADGPPPPPPFEAPGADPTPDDLACPTP